MAASHTHTPSASGRSTPLNFRDVVSVVQGSLLLQECGHVLECACKYMQEYATTILTSVSHQVHDVMVHWRNETDSEAHQVCVFGAVCAA